MNDISKIAMGLMNKINGKFKCHTTVTWCEEDRTIWFCLPTGGEADTMGKVKIGNVYPEMDGSGGLNPLSLKEWYEVMHAS